MTGGEAETNPIESGTGLLTYPDRYRLEIEWRAVPGETDEIVENQLRTLMPDDRS